MLRRLASLLAARRSETLQSRNGRVGEKLAARFLAKKGMHVLVRNWRHEREEIDLVLMDGDVLVFVEVKTRSGRGLVPGYFAVNKRKREALRRAFRSYLRSLRKKPHTFRFDIVEVILLAGGSPEVLHFENIPFFDKHFGFESGSG